ncbi:MAG: sensor histidine kinase [Sphingobacteriales bacterium]
MKKCTLLFLIFTVVSSAGYCQKSPVEYSPSNPYPAENMIQFDGYQFNPLTGVPESVQQGVMNTRIYDILNLNDPPNLVAWNKAHPKYPILRFIPKSPLLLGVKFSAGWNKYPPFIAGVRSLSTAKFSAGWNKYPPYQVKSLSKNYIGYFVADSADVTVVAMGINSKNVKDFRYHVVENDSTEIVPWSTPRLQQQYGAKTPYGFLGRFKAPGKQIMIEVVNIKDYHIRDGMIFNWLTNFKPVISHILADKIHHSSQFFNISMVKRNYGYATKFDSSTGLPLDLHFPVDTINELAIYFKSHKAIPYDIYWVAKYKNAEDTTAFTNLISSGMTDSCYQFLPEYFQEPGKYELLIYPTGLKDKDHLTKLSFEITVPLLFGQKFTLRQIIPFLLLAAVLFISYYLFNRRRLKKADQQRATANLKLSLVRSQLNPHFMFNALTSIQNLMNQQDNDGANHYLSKFAGLTRQVLNASGQELISLEDELQIISDYLQMEQLRFGFSYIINVDAAINKANTQIPSMLLQPFIENAAKHGVSALQNKGKIEVDIIKQTHNLILTVNDNGSGFGNKVKTNSGFGLKLSDERIALLNQVYKDQVINLQINSNENGTKITITLKDWV